MWRRRSSVMHIAKPEAPPEPKESLLKIYEDELEKERNRTWITRKEFTRGIDKNKIGQKLYNTFIRILKHGSNVNLYYSPQEFILMFVLHELNMNHVMMICMLMNIFGLGFTLGMMILTTFLIEMPILMYIIFICSYTKKLCLNFFECIPIMKGLSYSLMIMFAVIEARRVALAVHAVVYISLGPYIVKWLFCQVSAITGIIQCVPINTTTARNVSCFKFHTPISSFEIFSTQEDVKKILLNYDIKHGNSYFGISVGYRLIIWIIIFLACTIGLSSLKKFYLRVQIICLITVFLLGMVIFAVRTTLTPTFSIIGTPALEEVSPLHFSAVITSFMQLHSIPFSMWLSVMKPDDLHPQSAAFFICVFKCLALIWMVCLYGICVLSIIDRYKFVNFDCLYLGGIDSLLAIAPDMFMYLPLTKVLTLLWVCPIVLLTMIYGIYVVNVIVDTMVQCWTKLQKFRILLTMLLCIAVASTNQMEICDKYVQLHELHNIYYGIAMINKANLCLFTISLHFLYTPVRFLDDFLFVYDYHPYKFWGKAWNVIPYVSLIMFFYSFAYNGIIALKIYEEHLYNGIMAVIAVGVLVFGILLYKTCIMLLKKTMHLINTPDPNWGPPHKMACLMRKYYFSKRDTRIRRRGSRQSVCKHKCYLHSENFERIVNRQSAVLERFQEAENANLCD